MLENVQEKNYAIFSKSIEQKIDDIIDLNFSKKKLKKFDRIFDKYLWTFIVGSALLFLSGFTIFFVIAFIYDQSYWILTIIMVILSFPGIICLFAYAWYKKNINKIYAYFLKRKNLIYFYNCYSQLFYPSIVIKKIDLNDNKSAEDIFGPKKKWKHNFNNVNIHGKFANYDFSVGTKTYTYLCPTEKSYYYENEEHLYLTINIDQTNFKRIIIKPQTKISKIFPAKKNLFHQLENSQFEHIFQIKYNEVLEVRKLLTQGVIKNLLDLAKDHLIPDIAIENEKLIIHQVVNNYEMPSKLLTSSNNKKYLFSNMVKQKIYKIYDIKNIIMQTITEDFEKIHNMLEWVRAFKLNLNYEIQNIKSKK